MLFLILSVLCSVLLGFIFKLFPRYGVHTLQAIVVNYFVCVSCAAIHTMDAPVKAVHFQAPWMPYALLLGFVFITGFNGAALTVQYFGVTISQIMQRMSILLTVPYVILMYGESSSMGKILGFFAALLAIVLVNWPQKDKKVDESLSKNTFGKWLLAVPILTWFLSSIIEIVFVKVKTEKMIAFGDTAFISSVFGTAGVLGTCFILVQYFSGKIQFNRNSILGGIVLGIPNYGSMFFMLQALSSGLEGSFFYPVNNVSIILVTAVGAFFFFKETYSRINLIGLICAIAAIVLMAV